MNCLVIGASGQVGGALVARCTTGNGRCLGTAHRNPRPGLAELDLRDGDAVAGLVAGCRPDVVFLPGAMTHVDHAETHPQECFAVNVAGTGHVARAVRRHGGTLVFFSTEHVFPEGPAAHPEDGPTAAQSVYARSKVAAEQQVRDLLPGRHLILRTSWVYGPDTQRKNFVYRAVRTLAGGEELVVPEDQYGQPTYAPDLADVALALVRGGRAGTFHVVGPEALTRLAFARLVAEVFALDASRIRGVPTAQLNQPAPRPLHVRLARARLQEALGRDPIRSPAEGLRALREAGPGVRPQER
jgi:dTDP-4-dehydrorhamnose reductase